MNNLSALLNRRALDNYEPFPPNCCMQGSSYGCYFSLTTAIHSFSTTLLCTRSSQYSRELLYKEGVILQRASEESIRKLWTTIGKVGGQTSKVRLIMVKHILPVDSQGAVRGAFIAVHGEIAVPGSLMYLMSNASIL